MKRKTIIIMISALLIAIMASGVSMAFLYQSSEQATNTFTAAKNPKVEIIEKFNGEVKSDVKVKVTDSDCPVYIRANIVISLKDDDGNTVTLSPEGEYTININSTNWSKGTDGFYYYKGALKEGESTENLINNCSSNSEDYKLSVDIIVQAIQANPDTAVKDAWGEAAASRVKAN